MKFSEIGWKARILIGLVGVWAIFYWATVFIVKAIWKTTSFRSTYIVVPALLLVLAVVWNAESLAGYAAQKILGNVRIPEGREMPLTRGMQPYSSMDVQVLGGKGQGLSCSVPWPLSGVVFPDTDKWSSINLQMRQACASHDYCYRHGAATYGFTQADCDFQLQEDAFQICQFISGKSQVGACQTRARVVALGVIFGGSNAFNRSATSNQIKDEVGDPPDPCEKPKDCSSTYFEYDPYPARSRAYSVYRTADSPSNLPKTSLNPDGRFKKAIYRFDYLGREAIVSVALPGASALVAQFELGGSYQFMASPPRVARVGNSTSGEDWFVWLQRNSLTNTLSRVVAIAPGRATLADWRCAMEFEGAWETNKVPGCAKGNDKILVRNFGRLPTALTDFDPYDPNTPDFVTVPSPVADPRLHLMTLSTHSCLPSSKDTTKVVNIPCVRDMYFTTDGQRDEVNEAQEPLALHDYKNPNEQSESDRYRNYASIPIAIIPPSQPSAVLLWTRREDADFEKNAVLRAAIRHQNTSAPFTGDAAFKEPRKKLVGYGEDQEPGVIVGRNTDQPFLMSMYDTLPENPDSEVFAKTWHFAKSDGTINPGSACKLSIHDEWFARPPVVVATTSGSSIVVTNAIVPVGSPSALHLLVGVLSIKQDGTCSKMSIADINDTLPGFKLTRSTMSKIPLLVDDFDGDGNLDAILPADPVGGRLGPQVLCSITSDGSCKRGSL